MIVPHPIETRRLILASIAGNGNSNESATPMIGSFNDSIPIEIYNTLAGFISSRLGRIPVEGEEIAAGGVIFTVDNVSRRRVVRVKARSVRT